ncbi:MAG: SPFH domain-containing protein [Polyangiaceae bacterium]|nr:SPFH domain-containing protein [Polyangiaceae bacterium]MCW5792049.1 SPFH domain-containing protein [Polyangiaceae bacterium]
MGILAGLGFGVMAWFFLSYVLGGFYTVGPNERAVICTFGKAQRLGNATTLDSPIAASLSEDERQRYVYPQVRVVGPGFYWKLPWQTVHKASIATATVAIGFDPEFPEANSGGQILEAVTKDQLNTGLSGQLRFTVSDQNLYAFLFGVKNPVAHVMGYFISILRGKIANFEAPHRGRDEAPAQPTGEGFGDDDAPEGGIQGISINDLRKNLRDLNERMDQECASAAARYGIELDAALITGIDPPDEVDAALAAINTAHNHVSSEVSLARAAAEQRLVESKRAVEIETLNAQAEVEPLLALSAQLRELMGAGGPTAVGAYVRNAKLPLHQRARQVLLSEERKA